jgi:steroid 5-alpha reductase family enzyme
MLRETAEAVSVALAFSLNMRPYRGLMTIFSFTIAVIYAFTALTLAMTVGWLIWKKTRNSGWIDTTWTVGVGVTTVLGTLLGSGLSGRAVLVSILVCIWAGRLGVHIALRTTTITDDPRYARLIAGWGADAAREMYWFAQKQAWVSVPLVLSILIAAWNPEEIFRLQDFLGAALLISAVGGEALADRQLQSFRADPVNRGRVCDQGLWRYSRHPNYFFEWVCWLAYPVIAIDFRNGYAWGWLAISAPIIMYLLLVRVSGIPLLEQHMLSRSGEEFRKYQFRTNAFFPGPPKI